ncbi:MAG: hypothetical protein K6E54_04450 [Bacteroidaceae bacterium]|nr:hypothetical protein [Bacteroidaceae bacterium]
MKRIKFIIIVAIAFFKVAIINASEVEKTEKDQGTTVITVKANKAGKLLVEAWADAFMKSHPNVQIKLVGRADKESDLTLVNHNDAGNQVTYVGRYAILPITTTQNPYISELKRKDWGRNDIKKLYFSGLDEDLDEEEESTGKAGKLRRKLTVYSGANSNSASRSFASYFGFKTNEIRGNKISGDDFFLLSAIEDDKSSITFNNMAYIYNTDTRMLRPEIYVLPLNLKADQEKALKSGNLDEVIKFLETESTDLIPIENIGFEYESLTPEVRLFLDWVVKDGQRFNNLKGFLTLGAVNSDSAISYR